MIPDNAMSTNITREDLEEFRRELVEEIRKLLSGSQPHGGQRWFKSYELKKIFPLSHGKIQRLRASGQLPHARFGRVLLYDYYDIEKLINAHKEIAPGQPPQTA